jgi:excisionase family DNA binding protein
MDDRFEPLLSTKEIAEYLNVKVSWIYDNSHSLPVIRIGRSLKARRADLDAFIESQMEHPRYKVA